jgi:hypothetical protein
VPHIAKIRRSRGRYVAGIARVAMVMLLNPSARKGDEPSDLPVQMAG